MCHRDCIQTQSPETPLLQASRSGLRTTDRCLWGWRLIGPGSVLWLPPLLQYSRPVAAVSGIRVIAFFLPWTVGSRLPFELFHRVAYN